MDEELDQFAITVTPSDATKPVSEMSADEELANSTLTGPAEVKGQSLTQGAEPSQATEANNKSLIDFSRVQQALSEGYSRDEISSYLQQEYKLSPEDADKQLITSVEDKIKQATNQGYTPDEIKAYLSSNNYDPTIIDNAIKSSKIEKTWEKYNYDARAPMEQAQELYDLYQNVYGKYSTDAKTVWGVFDDSTALEARQEINQLNVSIAEKLKEKGLDTFISPVDGSLMVRNEQGIEEAVDSSMLDSIYNAKSEMSGAIAGSIAGAKLGMRAPGTSKAYAVPAGVIIGGMMGAASGRAADLTINAFKLKETLEADLYKTQMIEAGIFDGVAGVVGARILRVGAAGLKKTVNAYDYLVTGNTNGALKALKEGLHISDDQAKEITQNFLATLEQAPKKSKGLLIKRSVDLNKKEQQILAISSTQKGIEGTIKNVIAENLKLTTSISKDIDMRAKMLTKAIDNLADPNVGKAIKDDLGRYETDVKSFYGRVKGIAGEAIDQTDFRFDYDKLAIEPILDNLSKTITNPVKKEQFLNYALRIQAASKDRTFTSLVNLRQAVNDFKYSKSGLNPTDIDALNTVINKIDGQINKAVKDYMPENGKQWLEQFNKAKTEYAKMKQLQENALYKGLNSSVKNEADLQRLLNKWSNDTDVDIEVFNKVMERLSSKVRAKAEVAAIKNLTKKFTYGNTSGYQAIDFPMLAKELASLNINTSEGKYLLKAVNELSNVFKNDAALASLTGKFNMPNFNTTFATSFEGKFQAFTLSFIWNEIRKLTPGKIGDGISLIKKLEVVLENPLKVKSVDNLIGALPETSKDDMRLLIKELQVEAVKNPTKQQDFKMMYKQSSSGTLAVTDGMLGKGIYLVDGIKKPNPELKVAKKEVNLSRLATLKDISALVGREVTEKDIKDITNLQEQLKASKYQGIRVEGRAMLFKED